MRSEAIQDFLKTKLGIIVTPMFLEDKYRIFWQNSDCKDSLDETTTILCSFHFVNKGLRARIGETLFLREFYGKNIVSWAHCVFEALEKEGIFKPDILDFSYIKNLLCFFGLETENLKGATQETITQKISKICKKYRHNYQVSEAFSSDYTFLKEKFTVDCESKKDKIPNSLEEILSEVFPQLKPFIMSPRKISFDSFDVLDVPSDGNCAFWAVLMASGKISSSDAPRASDAMKGLRSEVADLAATANVDPDFVNLLRTPGRWNAGIHGGVGLEALHYVARYLGRQIILIENEGGVFSYWNSRENNLVLHAIKRENIGNFIKDEKTKDEDIIFIYHEGNHFQAIVKK